MCDSQNRARSATGSGTAPSSAIGGITGPSSLPMISKSAAAIRSAGRGQPRQPVLGDQPDRRSLDPDNLVDAAAKRTRSPIRSAPRGVSPLIPLPAC